MLNDEAMRKPPPQRWPMPTSIASLIPISWTNGYSFISTAFFTRTRNWHQSDADLTESANSNVPIMLNSSLAQHMNITCPRQLAQTLYSPDTNSRSPVPDQTLDALTWKARPPHQEETQPEQVEQHLQLPLTDVDPKPGQYILYLDKIFTRPIPPSSWTPLSGYSIWILVGHPQTQPPTPTVKTEDAPYHDTWQWLHSPSSTHTLSNKEGGVDVSQSSWLKIYQKRM